MKTVPNIWSADELQSWPCGCEVDGKYYMVRPTGFYGLMFLTRFKIAYNVFVGNYDALMWKEGE